MKNILLSSLVASLLITGTYAKETVAKDATVKQVNKVSLDNAKKDASKQIIKAEKDAIESLKYAQYALIALDKGDKKEATSNIEKALGKLEVTLASKNIPKLLPVSSQVTIAEFIGTSDTIKKIVKESKDLLDDYKVQAAKEALSPLKSEIISTVVSIPLATYPQALKETATLIHDNKVEEAKILLATALSTLVEVETVTPIPLVEATDLIAAAAAIAQEDTDKAELYLNAAQEQLKIAKYLGYVSHSSITYKALDDAIVALKLDIKSKEIKSLFTNLQTKIKDFTSNMFSSKEESK